MRVAVQSPSGCVAAEWDAANVMVGCQVGRLMNEKKRIARLIKQQRGECAVMYCLSKLDLRNARLEGDCVVCPECWLVINDCVLALDDAD